MANCVERFNVLKAVGRPNKIMENISYQDFQKLNLQIGKIVSAEPVDGSNKLLKLKVDLGSEERQILAGIAQFHKAIELEGKEFVFITNLEPRQIMGLESQGMMLCADTEDGSVCLTPLSEVPAGAKIR